MGNKTSLLKNLMNIGIAIIVLTASMILAKSLSGYTDRLLDPNPGTALAENRENSTLTSYNISRPSFVEIVKQENPAVVNISSISIIKHSSRNKFRTPMPFKGQDPFWDFFEKFRGEIPRHDIPRQSLGSGFIISKDGYIFTNNHVIEKADKIKVTLSNGKEYDAKIVGTDSKTDIALIKIESDDDLPISRLGDSDSLEVGEWVIAIGNPFRLGHSVTAGIVSAKGRMIGQGPYDDFIQTDASINPGNSGGPLINNRGEVIGINSAIYTAGGGGGNIGIGFAIPINMAKMILDDLKEKGGVTRGWLGVMIQKITPEIAKSFNLQTITGALVGDVVKGSPAEKAGFERGDIIIKFGNINIQTFEDLPKVVAATKPDTTKEIVIIRDGKKKILTVKIAVLKGKESESSLEKSEERIGLMVQNITPAIAEQNDLDSNDGVIVSKVEPGSPAYEAGIRRGQIILEINRKTIKDVSDFNRLTSSLKEGDTMIALVKEGKRTRYLGLTVKEE